MFKYFVRYKCSYYMSLDFDTVHREEINSDIIITDTDFNSIDEVQDKIKEINGKDRYYDIIAMNRL